MLVRFSCPSYSTHDHVLVEVCVGASEEAAMGSVAAPCPQCGRGMEREKVE